MANERILVVDDEKGVVRSCVRILERQGYIASGRTDSHSVPELLKQETFDLLLTDIRMPRIDGLELLRIAKQIDPRLTVVLITGYGTMEDAINAIRLGAEGFIMKPFEPEDLVLTIRDNLARRSLMRDSLRLQTLLPLLEINQILQVSGGETSLIRRVLEIAQRETGASRISWLSYQPAAASPFERADRNGFEEIAVVPHHAKEEQAAGQAPTSRLTTEMLALIPARNRALWVLADGSVVENLSGQPNIVGAALPLTIKGQLVGILTAETGQTGRSGPFDPISLDLLSVLAGQLAIIIENVQLFQQTETLRAFNEDIIQNMTNGLIAIDQAKNITAFNPAAAAMLGYPADEALQQPIHKALNGTETLIKIFEKTLATGQAHSHQEITIHRRDGSDLPIAISTAPLAAGQAHCPLAGVVGVVENLSEIKALEAERRRLDRLAALGEMSAVVAHEIRNPVAGIAAGIEYLARHIPQDSPDFVGVAMIEGEIERVNRILEDILFVARPLQLTLTDEDLAEIIETVIQRCQPQINESWITVSVKHAEKLPRLKVDRQRLEQVLTNLIINAIQAMPNGGRLLLQSRTDPPLKEGKANKIVITIADTGPGIPAEVQRRIFEPFFTTKTRGTGLGLAVASRIIEAHEGTLGVESKAKKGSRFVIKLPIERGSQRGPSNSGDRR